MDKWINEWMNEEQANEGIILIYLFFYLQILI